MESADSGRRASSADYGDSRAFRIAAVRLSACSGYTMFADEKCPGTMGPRKSRHEGGLMFCKRFILWRTG
ncbi:MAG: hypothetical protein WC284_07540 [Candidimonas sp.]